MLLDPVAIWIKYSTYHTRGNITRAHFEPLTPNQHKRQHSILAAAFCQGVGDLAFVYVRLCRVPARANTIPVNMVEQNMNVYNTNLNNHSTCAHKLQPSNLRTIGKICTLCVWSISQIRTPEPAEHQRARVVTVFGSVQTWEGTLWKERVTQSSVEGVFK